MSWFADKVRKWEASIDRRAGLGAGGRVTAGWEALGDDLEEIAEWSREAQARLEVEVPDESARREIMLERSCVFTEEFGEGDILVLRRLYRETGSAEAVVRAMRENPGRFGDPFIEDGVIVEIRRPRDPAAFSAASTPREKQIAACFCPLSRETHGGLPKEYCCCSAGWYRGIYEGVFGRPVDVTVDESLLAGDGRCRFTIRIPGVQGR
ncbi:hypothetical protein GX411_08670 [Candidatus Fermentibacteria bacterium]|nr:hypothetical protein [Candidatus Fermentibacteria bacterium]